MPYACKDTTIRNKTIQIINKMSTKPPLAKYKEKGGKRDYYNSLIFIYGIKK